MVSVMSISSLGLPHRVGARPSTTRTNPHSQLDQRPSWMAVERVVKAAADLPDVTLGASLRAPPGTIGLRLEARSAHGGEHAFLLGREFAHVHPMPDGSLHLTLPPSVRGEALSKGWAEPHPMAGRPTVSPPIVMVYAPRDEAEADVASRLVHASREFAKGART